MQKQSIFLDRDGVLIYDRKDYVRTIEEAVLLPNTLESIQILWANNYQIFVVTNQSGVAKGLYTTQTVQQVHQYLEKLFRQNCKTQGEIYWYFCPHNDKDNCVCRKPKPGLILEAANQHSLYIKNSWMVGDALRDIEAGLRVGCKTCLVQSGQAYTCSDMKPHNTPDRIYKDLYHFVCQEIM